jgi:hypothetical protein
MREVPSNFEREHQFLWLNRYFLELGIDFQFKILESLMRGKVAFNFPKKDYRIRLRDMGFRIKRGGE